MLNFDIDKSVSDLNPDLNKPRVVRDDRCGNVEVVANFDDRKLVLLLSHEQTIIACRDERTQVDSPVTRETKTVETLTRGSEILSYGFVAVIIGLRLL